VVYMRRFNFDQAREASILTRARISYRSTRGWGAEPAELRPERHGFNASASKMLRRSFARVGITYGYDDSRIVPGPAPRPSILHNINFQGVNGPNSLVGIKTSSITPSYSYNTVNHPISPTGGKSLFISTQFAGSVLGGNVNTIRQPSTPSISSRTRCTGATFWRSISWARC